MSFADDQRHNTGRDLQRLVIRLMSERWPRIYETPFGGPLDSEGVDAIIPPEGPGVGRNVMIKTSNWPGVTCLSDGWHMLNTYGQVIYHNQMPSGWDGLLTATSVPWEGRGYVGSHKHYNEADQNALLAFFCRLCTLLLVRYGGDYWQKFYRKNVREFTDDLYARRDREHNRLKHPRYTKTGQLRSAQYSYLCPIEGWTQIRLPGQPGKPTRYLKYNPQDLIKERWWLQPPEQMELW